MARNSTPSKERLYHLVPVTVFHPVRKDSRFPVYLFFAVCKVFCALPDSFAKTTRFDSLSRNSGFDRPHHEKTGNMTRTAQKAACGASCFCLVKFSPRFKAAPPRWAGNSGSAFSTRASRGSRPNPSSPPRRGCPCGGAPRPGGGCRPAAGPPRRPGLRRS